MAETVLSILTEKLEEQRKVLDEAISAGRAVDFSEYKYMVGQSRGLAVAMNLAKDLESSLMESEDDD